MVYNLTKICHTAGMADGKGTGECITVNGLTVFPTWQGQGWR